MKSVMHKPLNAFAILAVMASLFAASVVAAPNDAEDVRRTVMGFSTAWNHHDMVAFGKLFAPDADFVNVQGSRWVGRQDIQMRHAWSHGAIPVNTPGFEGAAARAYYGIFKNSMMRFTDVDVRFLRKDVAVAHVSWVLRGDARTPDPRRGVLLFVLTRQDGGWAIASAQNTEINRTVK
ncbi:MAG: SgcJ/EcaC family oxidoreductase [Candidatus Dormibacteria bacterium]